MCHLEYKFSNMTASSYSDQNYTGTSQFVTTSSLTHHNYNYTGGNQPVNTETTDIPSLKFYDVKKIYKKRSGK